MATTSTHDLRSSSSPVEQPLPKLQQNDVLNSNRSAYVDVFPPPFSIIACLHMLDEDSGKVKTGIPIQIGTYFDVFSLLCSSQRDYLVRYNDDRVPVSTLKGKSLVLCCFSIPLCPETDGYAEHLCRALVYSYSESSRSDFEMVLVAKMRPDCSSNDDEQKAAFDSFFSAFACLAIPFSDSCRRDYVAKCLGITEEFPLATLVVDPLHNVVQLGHHPNYFLDYGAYSFPFTNERLLYLFQADRLMMLRSGSLEMETEHERTLVPTLPPPTLEELLDCKPSDLLYRINNDKETVCVSDLKQKLVGLYLCVSGGWSFDELTRLHHTCKAQGLDFEIVIVYIPCLIKDVNLEWLEKYVSLKLMKQNICAWWASPFRDMVSRRLLRMYGFTLTDGLIILGPGGKFIERCGRAFINMYGVSGYPFSTEVYVDRHVARLSGLTLESLLTVSREQNYVVRNDGAQVPVAELRGRNILLYINCQHDYGKGSWLYDKLCGWYTEMKSKDLDFEVVYIPVYEKLACDGEPFCSMEWLGFPWAPRPILEQLFLRACDCFPTFITFGADGRIRSIGADKGTIDDAFQSQDMRKVLLERLERRLKEMNDDVLAY